MTHPKRGRPRHVGMAAAGAAALFVGMLFWAKLRVVESIPRSAYADPDAVRRAGGERPTPTEDRPASPPAPDTGDAPPPDAGAD